MKSLKIIIFVLFGLAATTTAVYFSWQEWKREKQINLEVKALESEAEKIRLNNESLRKRVAYFETEEFREGVAKEKFNLQKPDEKVVFIKPGYEPVDIMSNSRNSKQLETTKKTPNYIKWWRQFLAY